MLHAESLQPPPKALCMLRTSTPLCICQKSTSWFQMPSCHSGYITQQALTERSLCGHSPEDLGPRRHQTHGPACWALALVLQHLYLIVTAALTRHSDWGLGQQTCIVPSLGGQVQDQASAGLSAEACLLGLPMAVLSVSSRGLSSVYMCPNLLLS